MVQNNNRNSWQSDARNGPRRSCLRDQSSDQVHPVVVPESGRERRSVSFSSTTEVRRYVDDNKGRNGEQMPQRPERGPNDTPAFSPPAFSHDDMDEDDLDATPLLPPINIQAGRRTSLTQVMPEFTNAFSLQGSSPIRSPVALPATPPKPVVEPVPAPDPIPARMPNNLGDLLKQSDIDFMHGIRDTPSSPPTQEQSPLQRGLLSEHAVRQSTLAMDNAYRSPILRNQTEAIKPLGKPTLDLDGILQENRNRANQLSQALSNIRSNAPADPLMASPTRDIEEEQQSPVVTTDHRVPSGSLFSHSQPSMTGYQHHTAPRMTSLTPASSRPDENNRFITMNGPFKSPLRVPNQPLSLSAGRARQPRRSLLEDDDDVNAADDDLCVTMNQLIRSPSHIVASLSHPSALGNNRAPARGSLEFDPEDYEEWLSRKRHEAKEPLAPLSADAELEKENVPFAEMESEEVVEAPSPIDRYGPGNPVMWSQLVNETGLQNLIYKMTLDDNNKDVSSNQDLWNLSTDQLKQLLDPSGNYARGDNICDYYPFVKRLSDGSDESMDGISIAVSKWVPFSENEFMTFVLNFSHYCAHLEVLSKWSDYMSGKVNDVVRLTTDVAAWESDVPVSLLLSDSFNSINEAVILTEGNALKNIEEVAAFGRRDNTLRSWTCNDGLKEAIPPTAENISQNALLQAIIDAGYEEDQKFSALVKYIQSQVKASRSKSDALFNAQIWVEIGYLTKVLNQDNHRKLAEHSKNLNYNLHEQMILVTRKFREKADKRKKHRERIHQRQANIENMDTMLSDGINDKKVHLAQKYRTMLHLQREMQMSLKQTVNDVRGIMKHAKVQGTALKHFLPFLLYDRSFTELNLYYTRARMDDGQSNPYLIEWETHWGRDEAAPLSPFDLLIHRQSSAPKNLIDLGHKFLTPTGAIEELNKVVRSSEVVRLCDDEMAVPTEEDLLELAVAEDFNPLIVTQCLDSIASLTEVLHNKNGLVVSEFDACTRSLRTNLSQLKSDRVAVQSVIRNSMMKTTLHWSNILLGSQAQIPRQICTVFMLWQIEEQEPWNIEDPSNFKTGRFYEGVRICIHGSCTNPAIWQNKTTENQSLPRLASLVTNDIMIAHQLELDKSLQSRFLYIVEAIANATAREWHLQSGSDIPLPRQVSKLEGAPLGIYDALIPDVQKYVSVLCYNFFWLLRDVRCLMNTEDMDLMTYEAGQVIPYKMPTCDYLRLRFALPAELLQSKFTAGHPLLPVILSLGSFYLSLKVDVAMALVHGGRIMFGIEDMSVVYQLAIIAPSGGVRMGHGREIKAINSILTDSFKQWFLKHIFCLPHQSDDTRAFCVDKIPVRVKTAANITESYLMSTIFQKSMLAICPNN